MEPNYYPGKPPEEQPNPIKWAEKELTEDEINQVLADHKAWFQDGCPGKPPHDLNRAILSGMDLSKTVLVDMDLSQALLSTADLRGTGLHDADLRMADLNGAFVDGALLQGADLRSASLVSASLRGVDLTDADLRGTSLWVADLRDSVLVDTDLRGADFTGARLENTEVTRVKVSRRNKFLGASGIGSTYGSARFRDTARHQDYIEELRTTWWGKWIVHPLWLIFADCGRTPWNWLAWCVAFVFFFAYAFANWVGAGAFHMPHLQPTFETMLYYSVVTFTTLGFGDVVPKTNDAAWWVMAEVIVGYIMLGGLISIFATKLVARRG